VNPKVAVIYYSATGTLHTLVGEYATGAEKEGAEVRVRRVAELAPPEAISSNDAWKRHYEATQDVPVATADDVRWADAVVFGSPTRFGNVAAQLKQFIDGLGPLWAAGELADKVYSGLTATSTLHGGHESTLLALYNSIYHFGGILVAPGFTDPAVAGNPYGPSHANPQGTVPPDESALAAARYAGRRVAKVTRELQLGRSAA
jgi:NAD(P)H dehydrogenase (quinone)